MTELGYDCCSEPLFDTTSSTVYGLLIPSYLGVAHHASTSCNCWLYRASSCAPGFSVSERRWKESDGRRSESGGVTAGNDEGILRGAVIEMVRIEVVIRVTERAGLANVLQVADTEGSTLIVRSMILVVAL